MKRLIISHIADPDGVTPIILSKLVFEEFDYILSENKDVNDNVKNNLDKYDFIYVVDLNISEDLADFIEANYKDKIMILDHHLSCNNMNKYSFIEVNAEGKESGTSLYYKYLLNNYNNDLLNRESTKMLVEHVRTMDIYDFSKTNKEEAEKLGMIFKIYGKDKFIDKFYNVIINDLELYSKEFSLDENLVYALIKAESNFDANATSGKSAKGLMQIVDDTAIDVAKNLGLNLSKEEVLEKMYDVDFNIKLGTKYLSILLLRYENIEIALTAYNAGIGTVDNWIEKGIIKKDGKDIENIPYKETNQYVRKILRDYKIYQKLYNG